MLMLFYYYFKLYLNEDNEDVIWTQDQKMRIIFLEN